MPAVDVQVQHDVAALSRQATDLADRHATHLDVDARAQRPADALHLSGNRNGGVEIAFQFHGQQAAEQHGNHDEDDALNRKIALGGLSVLT